MTDELEPFDGDVRYDTTVSGYCRRRRGRLRETQRHVNLLVTSVARDHGSAAVELQDERLASTIREAGRAIRAYRGHRRSPSDTRAALTHAAAMFILWAEALDTPPELKGPRLGRVSPAHAPPHSGPPDSHVTYVVPPGLVAALHADQSARSAPEKQEKQPDAVDGRSLRAVPPLEGQMSLPEEAA